jgi:hypothetical protein
MELNLVRFKVGDLVTWDDGLGEAKFVGDENGMAIVVLTKPTEGRDGHVFAKGLEARLPHSTLRPVILN